MTIKSDIGFYVGDICYALTEDIYTNFWGKKHSYADGVFEVGGFSFAVGSTARGDGVYYDTDGRKYPVDAGVIGLVPLELAIKKRELGAVFYVPGKAEFKSKDGIFDVTLPGGINIHIDTCNIYPAI